MLILTPSRVNLLSLVVGYDNMCDNIMACQGVCTASTQSQTSVHDKTFWLHETLSQYTHVLRHALLKGEKDASGKI